MKPITHIKSVTYNGATDQLEIVVFWFIDSQNFGNAVVLKIKPALVDKAGLDTEIANALQPLIQAQAKGGVTVDGVIPLT